MIKILKNKLSKKVIISLILVGFIAVGSTLAYLFDISDLLTNTFSRASIHTEIEEDENMTNLTKNPSVVNTDVTDVIVRVRLSISNKELFEKHFGLAGIDANYAITDELTIKDNKSFWTMEPVDGDRYDCYYYYKYVLKGTETGPDGTLIKDQTEPLFDKILKKTGELTYTTFEFNDDGSVKNEDDIDILKYLNDIDITIYQESVPVTVTKDNDTELNADKDNDGEVDIGIAKEIFGYFESSPDAQSNN